MNTSQISIIKSILSEIDKNLARNILIDCSIMNLHKSLLDGFITDESTYENIRYSFEIPYDDKLCNLIETDICLIENSSFCRIDECYIHTEDAITINIGRNEKKIAHKKYSRLYYYSDGEYYDYDSLYYNNLVNMLDNDNHYES